MTTSERKEHIMVLAKEALDTLDLIAEEMEAKDRELAEARDLIEKLTRANKEYADKFAELIKDGTITQNK